MVWGHSLLSFHAHVHLWSSHRNQGSETIRDPRSFLVSSCDRSFLASLPILRDPLVGPLSVTTNQFYFLGSHVSGITQHIVFLSELARPRYFDLSRVSQWLVHFYCWERPCPGRTCSSVPLLVHIGVVSSFWSPRLKLWRLFGCKSSYGLSTYFSWGSAGARCRCVFPS